MQLHFGANLYFFQARNKQPTAFLHQQVAKGDEAPPAKKIKTDRS